MAIFAVNLTFTSDTDKRLATRPTHREYLKTLLDAGKLVESGPFTDDSGALMVYEAPDLAAAEAQLAADPYAQAGGIIERSTINEWNIVMTRHAS
ncbi:MAG: YciI family protein [Thermomicrobiales bacterium]